MPQLSFATFAIEVPEHWFDVTAEMGADASPITLACEDGVGALQFSVEALPGDKPAQLTTEQLRGMLREFAKAHELGTPRDILAREEPLPQLTASFSWEGDFLRVWYLAAPGKLAFLTYTCEKNAAFANELLEAEAIVRTLRMA